MGICPWERPGKMYKTRHLHMVTTVQALGNSQTLCGIPTQVVDADIILKVQETCMLRAR